MKWMSNSCKDDKDCDVQELLLINAVTEENGKPSYQCPTEVRKVQSSGVAFQKFMSSINKYDLAENEFN